MSDNTDWRPTLERLGIPENFLSGRNGPCPFCGGRDRWRFTDFEGKGSFICSHCTPEGGNGFELVKRYFSCDFQEALEKVTGKKIITHVNKGLSQEKTYANNRREMITHYRNLVGGRGTPAEAYLNKRGIPFPDPFYMNLDPEVWGVRREAFGCFWLPNYWDGFGAMVWKALEPSVSRITQLHFTILTNDGDKAPVDQQKKYSKAIAKMERDSFRLAPISRGNPNEFIIAEGIETALSAQEIFRRLAPNEIPPSVYASMDAGMMARFKPFETNNDVKYWICGDRDESNTGQKAAAACKMNIGSATGSYDRAYVVLPDTEGQDWNDILLSGDTSRMMSIVKPV